MNQTFEDFLNEKHSENYTGTDDNMPEAFETWTEELGWEELMEYTTEWHNKLVKLSTDSMLIKG